MKCMICKFLVTFLVLTLILPLLPAEATESAAEPYYGEAYKELKTEQQRHAYRLVEEGIAGLSPSVLFWGEVDVYRDEIDTILRAVCVDHPEYFWFLESGTLYMENQKDQNQITSFEPQYILDGQFIKIGSQEFMDATYAFHSKVSQIIAGIPANLTTEYEIALYLHDYLAENVTYTLEGEHPSAYAALIHGEAACYGYSKAYQCLLNAAGIRARTITGTSPNENGQLIGHAWNQVWIDGECYYVDVTWDDFDAVIIHEYFGMSLEMISKDHYADPEFLLQNCDHEPLNYHARNMGIGTAQIGSSTTAAELASCIRLDSLNGKNAEFSCEIRYTGTSFESWLKANGEELFNLLGLSSVAQIYYYYMDDVYYLQLVDTKFVSKIPSVLSVTLGIENVELCGPGARFQLRPTVETDGYWTPNLVYESSDPAVAQVDPNGYITAVSTGTAQILVRSEDGLVTAVCAVTVTNPQVHTHTMRAFPSKSATCSQNGHEDYYLCTGCGLRFGDEAGTVAYTKVEDFILPIQHLKLFYFSQGGEHVQRCKCGVYMEETREAHVDEDGDGVCEICKMLTSGGFAPADQQKQDMNNAKWVWPVVIAVVVIAAAITTICVIRYRRRWHIG